MGEGGPGRSGETASCGRLTPAGRSTRVTRLVTPRVGRMWRRGSPRGGQLAAATLESNVAVPADAGIARACRAQWLHFWWRPQVAPHTSAKLVHGVGFVIANGQPRRGL